MHHWLHQVVRVKDLSNRPNTVCKRDDSHQQEHKEGKHVTETGEEHADDEVHLFVRLEIEDHAEPDEDRGESVRHPGGDGVW